MKQLEKLRVMNVQLAESELGLARATLVHEIVQREEEGCEVMEIREVLEKKDVTSLTDVETQNLLDTLARLPVRDGFGYVEPSDLRGIRKARAESTGLPEFETSSYESRLTGAWFGRCAGCCLGKPVEGWSHGQIREYLDAIDVGGLRAYVPVVEPNPVEGKSWHHSAGESTRGNIDGMPRDDDIDYMILALEVLEQYGPDARTADYGSMWLDRLPYARVYTAERAAYRNLILGYSAAEAALHNNPYREWIGAQIRADVLGYVVPGRPEAAARLAYEDAALSHVKNGVYGEMWAAATISAAFLFDHPADAIRAGLSQIPSRSRLYEAIENTLSWTTSLPTWQEAYAKIQAAYGHYHFVHTINNACFVVLGLMYGHPSFSDTIGIAVECGEDTDCNGATAGSVFGALHGEHSIPAEWTLPLGDRVRTIVPGRYGHGEYLSITGLVQRTSLLAHGAFSAL
ncbi:MAG TPA: ADP-ribosylglycohydrolase family protein [Chloroflexi bacterium]|nr:ADP-ribosylglycohydrolase family protein [Chloroflexota bacterium]|tara:strand:- start:14173 stop:15546 length:1374 start_codon:yes stop_codon:yes gene_type:complete